MSKVPYKAKPIELDKRARVAELALAALHSASKQIRANTRGARQDVDPDFTHQLRVGARRARVVVRLFSKRIGESCARSLEHDLRWIFQLAGTLRDRDIVLSETVAPLADDEREDSMPALVLLFNELTRQRKRAAQELKEALASKRYKRMLRTLDAVEYALAQSDERGPRAREWAQKRLDKRLAQVLARREAALGDDEAERHELRKQLKKLRYAAELVRSLWPKKRVKRYLDEMEALQDALGLLNDAAIGRQLVEQAAAAAPGDAAQAIALCEASMAAKVGQHAESFEPAFFAFERATPFWRKPAKDS